MTIYIVQGECGQYDDQCDWPVKAFVSEKAAQDFVDALTLEYAKLPKMHGLRVMDGVTHSLDPNMQSDYTGTDYSYYPLDLEGV